MSSALQLHLSTALAEFGSRKRLLSSLHQHGPAWQPACLKVVACIPVCPHTQRCPTRKYALTADTRVQRGGEPRHQSHVFVSPVSHHAPVPAALGCCAQRDLPPGGSPARSAAEYHAGQLCVTHDGALPNPLPPVSISTAPRLPAHAHSLPLLPAPVVTLGTDVACTPIACLQWSRVHVSRLWAVPDASSA